MDNSRTTGEDNPTDQDTSEVRDNEPALTLEQEIERLADHSPEVAKLLTRLAKYAR